MNYLLTVLSNIGGSGSEEHFLGKTVKEKLGLKFVYFKIPGQGLFVLHLLSFKYFKKFIDRSSRPEVSYKKGVS